MTKRNTRIGGGAFSDEPVHLFQRHRSQQESAITVSPVNSRFARIKAIFAEIWDAFLTGR